MINIQPVSLELGGSIIIIIRVARHVRQPENVRYVPIVRFQLDDDGRLEKAGIAQIVVSVPVWIQPVLPCLNAGLRLIPLIFANPFHIWNEPHLTTTQQSTLGTWSTSSDRNGALWQFFRTNLHFKGFVQRQPASERQRCFLPAFQGRGCADREAGWWLSCMETILKFPVGTIASDTVNECRVSGEVQRKAKHWALIIGALEKLCQRKVFFLRLFSLLLQLLFEIHSLSI